MASRKTAASNEPTTVYLVERDNKESLRITVPSSWKVTFGPMVPGERGFSGNATCLRFYEAKDQQRAIFTNVRSFRDMSIPVERKVVKVEQASKSKQDHTGSQVNAETSREESWIKAD